MKQKTMKKLLASKFNKLAATGKVGDLANKLGMSEKDLSKLVKDTSNGNVNTEVKEQKLDEVDDSIIDINIEDISDKKTILSKGIKILNQSNDPTIRGFGESVFKNINNK